jgi:hypothetical protein
MSEHFKIVQAAQDYLAMHDDNAKRLSRSSMGSLRSVVAVEQASRRITVIAGDPVSRDELVAEILALRWPYITEAREVVAGHKARELAGDDC